MTASLVLAAGCVSGEASMTGPVADSFVTEMRLLGRQTVEGVGAGQGVAVFGDKVYLYGDRWRRDSERGVIREYALEREPVVHVRFTGREIVLTAGGEDVAPHPTGLTRHPEYGVFLGNTVNRRGTIFHVDWERALADGNLDRAILNTTRDEVAVNGCRPEFVRVDGRWMIATSDYGDAGNQLRLYDPVRLAEASSTAESGVLVDAMPCGPFVQTVHWHGPSERLVLVQNREPGLLYRLTFVRLDASDDLRGYASIDLEEPRDELEGAAIFEDGLVLMLSAMSELNVTFGRLEAMPD
ncbi:hypothetical protein [Mucisphaera calidilacus]|nr:hypothetical protein [Mucisphaera calidilacus]